MQVSVLALDLAQGCDLTKHSTVQRVLDLAQRGRFAAACVEERSYLFEEKFRAPGTLGRSLRAPLRSCNHSSLPTNSLIILLTVFATGGAVFSHLPAETSNPAIMSPWRIPAAACLSAAHRLPAPLQPGRFEGRWPPARKCA